MGGILLFAVTWTIAACASKRSLALLEIRLRPVVEGRFVGREVLRTACEANIFGLESRGLGQVRGNGALVLTRDGLYFLQAVTKRKVAIPLGDILSVSVVKSHLRKRVGRPLLRVDFRAGGGADAVAWFVHDPPAWKEAVEAVLPS